MRDVTSLQDVLILSIYILGTTHFLQNLQASEKKMFSRAAGCIEALRVGCAQPKKPKVP